MTAAAPTLEEDDADRRQRHWQGIYQTKAPTAVSWYQARPELSLALIARTGIGPDARVVDVGGGASTLVDALLDRGFHRVDILDVAPAALDHAKRRLGTRASRVGWIVADVTRWRPTTAYDLWHDRAVFHFLTEEADRRRYAAVLANAVRSGGHAIVATFALDGPERCSGLPVQRHSPATLAAAFAPHFALVESEREEHVTPAGATQRFVHCRFARR